MTDFTKEELEIIYHCTEFVTEYNWLYDRYDFLMDKIKHMIENYPEEGYLSYDEFPRYSIKHVLLKSDSGDNQT